MPAASLCSIATRSRWVSCRCFLVDVKYEDKATVAGEWADPNDPGKGKRSEGKGDEKGDFSGTAVSQASPSPT